METHVTLRTILASVFAICLALLLAGCGGGGGGGGSSALLTQDEVAQLAADNGIVQDPNMGTVVVDTSKVSTSSVHRSAVINDFSVDLYDPQGSRFAGQSVIDGSLVVFFNVTPGNVEVRVTRGADTIFSQSYAVDLNAITEIRLPRPQTSGSDGTTDTPDVAESPATCGDGHVDSGEDCDDGGESATCDADCTTAKCGDSTVNLTAGETCDDGNTIGGDGCDSSCQVEKATNIATFTPLGDLPGGIFESYSISVSADGLVAVGRSSAGTNDDTHAFRWTRDGGMVDIGNFYVNGISGNGTVVVGDDARNGIRWVAGTGVTELSINPIIAADVYRVFADDVSCDGSVVVGEVETINSEHAIMWTKSGEMMELTPLPGGNGDSRSTAISCNGLVIVGVSSSTTGSQAFRWTSGTGMVGLGYLSGTRSSFHDSYADWVSSDGSIIVGESKNDDGNDEAFRWTESTGMVGLGMLPERSESRALAASSNASVIVGKADGTCLDFASPCLTKAFIWDEVHGMRDLKHVLVSDFGLALTSWTLELAEDISEDGLTIVGTGTNPDGNSEGWIVTLPHYP